VCLSACVGPQHGGLEARQPVFCVCASHAATVQLTAQQQAALAALLECPYNNLKVRINACIAVRLVVYCV
jgi:hypothetical protein